MNKHTLSISTTESNFANKIVLDTLDLFDYTEVTLDLTGVYSEIFPNYVSIDWGDKSPVEEPDIEIFRDYKTQSIFPELTGAIKPKFLDTPIRHKYYQWDF